MYLEGSYTSGGELRYILLQIYRIKQTTKEFIINFRGDKRNKIIIW